MDRDDPEPQCDNALYLFWGSTAMTTAIAIFIYGVDTFKTYSRKRLKTWSWRILEDFELTTVLYNTPHKLV